MPTFGSLFAGIGGIDLGLERAGWTGRWQVEYEPFCQRVLAKHWPDVTRYGDIHDVDWSQVELVDLIAGGFPCQPVSIAGRKLAQADDRWLWPEFARAVGALRPRYVLVENVPNLLGVSGGRAFGEVIGDLAALGYDAEWDGVPAAAIGAPHLRDRVWIIGTQQSGVVADPSGGRRQDHGLRAGRDESGSSGADRTMANDARQRGRWSRQRALDGRAAGGGSDVERPNGDPSMADTDALGRDGRPRIAGAGGRGQPADGRHPVADADDTRSQGHRRRSVFGDGAGQWITGEGRRSVEGQWFTEPDVGRVAHGVPARVDRLRSLGNAVVPQVVEIIGRRLMEALA